MRLCVGTVFAFSGFVKGIDPWGTVYKIGDYLAAMNIVMPDNVIVAGCFALIGLEFICGMFLLFGCYRRISVWIATAFMAVMLPLTAWIAIADPVPDCGCFGDAWVISNTATFIKNIFISAATCWLLIYNRHLRTYIAPSLQWIEFVMAGAFIIIVSWYGYAVQPAIDFRPYPVGCAIVSEDNTEVEAEYSFIYRKGEVQQEFDIDNLPSEDDGWEFVDRHLKHAAKLPDKQHSLVIYDSAGEDVSSEIIPQAGNILLILYPTLDNFNIASTYKINTLYDYCVNNGISVAAVMAATPQQIEYYKDVAMPDYPIYTAEDTAIKEVARGCPAIVFVRDGRILWKTQLRSLDSETLENNVKVEHIATDLAYMLPWLGCIIVCGSLFLILLGMLPVGWRSLIANKHKASPAGTTEER